MTEGTIADCHWSACQECVHAVLVHSRKTVMCDVDDRIDDNVRLESDRVVCGLFEVREPDKATDRGETRRVMGE